MVVLPRGEFLMGSPDTEVGRYDYEGPQHKVQIDYDLAVGKFAVTFDEWDTCFSRGEVRVNQPSDNGLGPRTASGYLCELG